MSEEAITENIEAKKDMQKSIKINIQQNWKKYIIIFISLIFIFNLYIHRSISDVINFKDSKVSYKLNLKYKNNALYVYLETKDPVYYSKIENFQNNYSSWGGTDNRIISCMWTDDEGFVLKRKETELSNFAEISDNQNNTYLKYAFKLDGFSFLDVLNPIYFMKRLTFEIPKELDDMQIQ